MLFNSFNFLIFFSIVATIHYLPIPVWLRKCNLVLASYLFYASWTWEFLPLLMFTTVFDYILANKMSSAESPYVRKGLCFLGVSMGLLLLAIFKFRVFIHNTAIIIINAHSHMSLLAWEPIETIPLGISFYTFESISYLVDVYRRRCQTARNLLDYSLFISFFPHLLAGPIVRPNDLLPQFHALGRPSRDQLGWGLSLVTIGLFQKIVVADQMAHIADNIFASSGRCGCLEMWIGSFAFGLQIYCDFSGYSCCAIGLALMLGLVINQNFNAPYAAVGLSDFWRRWHISLSTWLRDYLYIPMGGNRCGNLRTLVNLMVTMFLGGLWHGASWTFAVWGLVHGMFLVVQRLLVRWCSYRMKEIFASSWAQLALCGCTFLLVDLSWVLFRTRTIGSVGQEYLTMLGYGVPQHGVKVLPSEIFEVATLVFCVFALHWRVRLKGTWAMWADLGWKFRSMLLCAMIMLILLTPGEKIDFIYFQF